LIRSNKGSAMSRPITNEIRSFVPPPAQLRTARDLLGWSLSEAADAAKLTEASVSALETDPRGGPGLVRLECAYEAAGITFKAYAGPSGQIFKTRLHDGEWHCCARRGPVRLAGGSPKLRPRALPAQFWPQIDFLSPVCGFQLSAMRGLLRLPLQSVADATGAPLKALGHIERGQFVFTDSSVAARVLSLYRRMGADTYRWRGDGECETFDVMLGCEPSDEPLSLGWCRLSPSPTQLLAARMGLGVSRSCLSSETSWEESDLLAYEGWRSNSPYPDGWVMSGPFFGSLRDLSLAAMRDYMFGQGVVFLDRRTNGFKPFGVRFRFPLGDVRALPFMGSKFRLSTGEGA
jgi:transcriptional regulator with XRE-family HTH domain